MSQLENEMHVENALARLELEAAIYNRTIELAQEELERNANGQNPQ